MSSEHHTTTDQAVAQGVDDDALTSLRRWNLGLTVLHAAQAVVVLVLANGFTITITSTFPQAHRGRRPGPRRRCSTCASARRSRPSCSSRRSTTA